MIIFCLIYVISFFFNNLDAASDWKHKIDRGFYVVEVISQDQQASLQDLHKVSYALCRLREQADNASSKQTYVATNNVPNEMLILLPNALSEVEVRFANGQIATVRRSLSELNILFFIHGHEEFFKRKRITREEHQ